MPPIIYFYDCGRRVSVGRSKFRRTLINSKRGSLKYFGDAYLKVYRWGAYSRRERKYLKEVLENFLYSIIIIFSNINV
jgi:hypothetical protein